MTLHSHADYEEMQARTCGLVYLCSGRDCVESLRSSNTELYPQMTPVYAQASPGQSLVASQMQSLKALLAGKACGCLLMGEVPHVKPRLMGEVPLQGLDSRLLAGGLDPLQQREDLLGGLVL